METIECVKSRRSTRKYLDKPIEKETIQKIVEAASYAPSWKNTQVTRYTVVENPAKKAELANSAVLGFTPNSKTMTRCDKLIVQSVVTGVSGFEQDGSFSTAMEDRWQTYDAGISAEAFCLAAYEYGVGTVILGIIDPAKIAEIIDLPKDQKVTSVICAGYPEGPRNAPPRKSADELLRFV